MRRLIVLVSALLGSGVVLATAVSSGATLDKRDTSAFGEYAVRFQPGTSLQAMTAAVGAAGGAVSEDMHQIAAVEVASNDGHFLKKILATQGVVDAFVDGHGPSANGQLGGSTPAGAAPTTESTSGADPWHDAFQWDDTRMNVPPPTPTTGAGVTVAVLDSGIDPSQTEVGPNDIGETNFIPCATLTSVFGKKFVSKYLGITDCGTYDHEGHGTWVASRIAGALNGFASNGVAPGAKLLDQKMLAEPYGFDSAWAIAAMLDACDKDANVLNMSLVEYNDPTNADDVKDYLLWVDAASYCTSKGVVLVAAAGNDHVRINRVNMTLGGRHLNGVGQVDAGSDGMGLPQSLPLTPTDVRGDLEVPGGLPGVIMVSATGNTTADASSAVAAPYRFATGLQDQLAHYSNYGSRVDVAAPGGARSFNVPSYDASGGDVYTDGYGVFGSSSTGGALCDTSLGTGCFKLPRGESFMWLQGTSQATANVSGVVAALLGARPALGSSPAAVLARLQATARRDMTNQMGPLTPSTVATLVAPCPAGYCHIATTSPIAFGDAYGAGIVNAGAAIG